MILPTFFKRRTSRRTSKCRPSLSKNTFPKYDSLETRNLLATFVVNTTADVVDADDGVISLREAISAANANEAFSDAGAGDVDGDRIEFAKLGKFSRYALTQGELTITDDLIIRGEGIGESAINADGLSRIFNVSTTERVQFRTLVMQGGATEGSGGLLNINASSDVVIRDSHLVYGVASVGDGGAINVVDSRLYVRSTQFRDNVSDNGGAIHAVGSDVRVVDSEFLGNRSNDSGGAIHATGGTLGLYGGSTTGNVAGDSGGAIYVIGSFSEEGVLVSSSSFHSNESSNGGAIFAGENTSAFILSGRFQGNGSLAANSTFSTGGAISSGGNGLYISDAFLFGNRATQGAAVYSSANYSNFRGLNVIGNEAFGSVGAGGGLLFVGLEAYVSDSTVSGNEAADVAGGIAVGSGKAVLRRVTVAGNSAANGGGGIWASPETTLRVFGSAVSDNVSGQRGGGISVVDSDLLITGSTVTNNKVTNGSGGGIAATNGTTLVFNSSISNNEADGNAGGLLVWYGYARLQNTVVNTNSSKATAGAIDARSSTLVLIGGEVSFNAATEERIDGAFGSRAGAVNVDSDSRMFVRGGTRFEFNKAQAFGGAIQVAGLLSVQDAEFVSNSAGSGGAVFLTADGSAYFERTLFSRNSAQDNGAAIFARGLFFEGPILILSDSTITENEVTDNENGRPVAVSEAVFWRETGGSNSDNTPNNGVGVL